MSKLKSFHTENRLECGIDEAGAGPLAGPVVAAAVIWPPDLKIRDDDDGYYEFCYLRDSKKLSKRQLPLVEEFVKFYAIDYSIAFVDNDLIDKINIRNSRILVMHRAVKGLNVVPEFLLVDGDAWTPYNIPEPDETIDAELVIDGDNKYQSIAAASILAKCARDKYVIDVMHKKYPNYGWDTNKGYGTKKHYAALQEHGATEFHRHSYNLKICKIKDDDDE